MKRQWSFEVASSIHCQMSSEIKFKTCNHYNSGVIILTTINKMSNQNLVGQVR